MPVPSRLDRYVETDKQKHFPRDFMVGWEAYETWDQATVGQSGIGQRSFEIREEDILDYNRACGETDPLMVDPPLRVLVVVATPSGVPALQVEKEWNNLQKAWESLRTHGLVTLERLEKPTLECLQKTLRRGEYHVFHFIGHGTYQSDRSFLLFEDEQGHSQRVGGDTLASYLSANPIRLAILNACEGARSSFEDPFSGVAPGARSRGHDAIRARQM